MSTPKHVPGEHGPLPGGAAVPPRPDPSQRPPGTPRPQPPGGFPGRNGQASCIEVPELVRLRYFYGQMLGAADFQAEQDYFREKLKLHNRCLHGYGVVCGLEVSPGPVEEDCAPLAPPVRQQLEHELRELERKRQEAEGSKTSTADLDRKIAEVRRRLDCLPEEPGGAQVRPVVRIDCGLAYDCEGNELVVRRELPVDLLAALGREDARWVAAATNGERSVTPPGAQSGPAQSVPSQPAGAAERGTLYVSLCYCAQPIGPVRPVLAEACGSMPDCTFGKLRDAVRVRVAREEPEQDERCEACCEGCHDNCVLLARIDDFVPGQPLLTQQIHNEVRRTLAPYVLTRIAGVSWTHGATYTDDEAAQLLGRTDSGGGLELRFSRPVLSSTITPGVVDIWVIEGGGGRHAYMYNMDVDVTVGTGITTDRIRIRQLGGERLDDGDRILVQVRASFVLDRCCYAVDGENLGGRAPLLAEYERFRRGSPPAECSTPRRGTYPWMSGNGVQGGNFESWFYIGSGSTGGKRRPGPKETR